MDESAPAPRTNRRTVLLGAGIALTLGGTTAATASCSLAAPTQDPAAGSGPATLAADEVPVGGGTIMDDADYVVTQPEAGEFKAFSKICTHQHCPVTLVRDAMIMCSCHGSQFSIVDGSVVRGPAREALPEFPTEVADDQITING